MIDTQQGARPLRFGDDAPSEPLVNSAACGWAGVPFELVQTTSTHSGLRTTPMPGSRHLRIVIDGGFDITFRGRHRDLVWRVRPGSMSFHSRAGMIPMQVRGSARMLVAEVSDSWVERLGFEGLPPERGVYSLASEDETARALALAMCTEVEREAQTGALFAESLSLSLLSYAFDRLPFDRLDVSGGLSDAQCRKLRRHIDERLTENLRVGQLAAVCGLKQRHFTTLFRRAFGVTPHRYVMQQRLARGATLLSSSSMDVAEVALGVGFSSQSHFTTAFRRAYHTTPKQYANQHRRVVQRPGSAA